MNRKNGGVPILYPNLKEEIATGTESKTVKILDQILTAKIFFVFFRFSSNPNWVPKGRRRNFGSRSKIPRIWILSVGHSVFNRIFLKQRTSTKRKSLKSFLQVKSPPRFVEMETEIVINNGTGNRIIFNNELDWNL